MKCGMVGLPNAGKSTLFNALMRKALAHAANFPFCTISPNVGQVPIDDARLQILAKIADTQVIVPTTLDCIDIAGLIKGAAQGEGLGNQFLGNIRNVDLILHVVRSFEDSFTNQQASPLQDISIIETELMLADMQILEKQLIKAHLRTNPHAKLCQILLDHLMQDKPLTYQDSLSFTSDEQAFLAKLGLITLKPMLYIINIAEEDLGKQLQYTSHLKKPFLICCAKLQDECNRIDDKEERDMILSSYDLSDSNINNILIKGYEMLNLITFFTAGEQEVRAWQISNNTFAPQAAGKIHGDFERGFICVEIISYQDFIDFKGWSGCKNAGKIRREGKKYIIKNGDICLFRHNT